MTEQTHCAPPSTADELALPRFLTRDEFAELVGVTRRTAEKWDAAGYGPASVRHGARLVRYPRAEVLRWLAEGDQPRTRTPRVA
ncbi:MAG: helix-turn-helix transcriptional regulator [Streptosporangiaceae bacterium]